MKRYIFCAALLVLVAGCSSDKRVEESEKDQPQGVIPQHQLQALEKAKQVEDTLKQAEQERRDQLDQ